MNRGAKQVETAQFGYGFSVFVCIVFTITASTGSAAQSSLPKIPGLTDVQLAILDELIGDGNSPMYFDENDEALAYEFAAENVVFWEVAQKLAAVKHILRMRPAKKREIPGWTLLAFRSPRTDPYLKQILLARMTDPNAVVRRGALEGLAELEPRRASDFALILLNDSDPFVQMSAATILLNHCNQKSVWEALQKMWVSLAEADDHPVRRNLDIRLTTFDGVRLPNVPSMHLLDLSWEQRQALIVRLKKFHHNGSDNVDWPFSYLLTVVGQDAVTEIVESLRSERVSTRRSAAYILSSRSDWARQNLSAIYRALRDEDAEVRIELVKAISAVGPYAKDATPLLIAMLKSPNVEVKTAAMEALGELGGDIRGAIPSITANLKSKNKEVRWTALSTLRHFGPVARDATAALLAFLQSGEKDGYHLELAFEALVQIDADPNTTIEPSLKLLKNPDDYVSILSAKYLSRFGSAAAAAIPKFSLGMESKHSGVRFVYTAAMASIGVAALPELEKKLRHPNAKVRSAAASALGAIGEPALKLLMSAMKDPDVWVKCNAMSGLGNIGAPASGAAPELIQALDHKNGWVILAAIKSLGAIGEAARPALPKLNELMNKSTDEEYKKIISTAIQGIAGTKGTTPVP